MVKINLTTNLIRDPNQLFSKVDNEIIMLSEKEGKYHALNEVGSRIWELLSEAIEVNAIVSTLLEEYDISNSECEKETLELLDELYDQGLVIIR